MLLEKYASVFNYLGIHHLFLLSPLLFSLFMVAEVFVLTFLKQARLLQWGQDFFCGATMSDSSTVLEHKRRT